MLNSLVITVVFGLSIIFQSLASINSLSKFNIRNLQKCINHVCVGITVGAKSVLSRDLECSSHENNICKCAKCIQIASNDDSWYNPSNQRIFDTIKNSYLPSHPEVYLNKELGSRNIIVIGEVHSNPCHHRVEFDIIKTLVNSKKSAISPVVIGMEAFYRQHQHYLDDFVFNHKNFDKLKKETKWDETWGYDLNYYSKILRYASEHNIRVIGLNLPYQIAHYVSQTGLANVAPKIKKFLPEVDLSKYKNNFG
jgi:hypothetical protein